MRAFWLLGLLALGCGDGAGGDDEQRALAAAGSAGGGSGGSAGVTSAGASSGGSSSTAAGQGGSAGATGEGGDSADQGGAGSGGSGPAVCTLDLVITVDTSGSMVDEAQTVEDNINANLATALEASGVDYRVILLTRHRTMERSADGPNATAICISSPLGGGMCPTPQPINGARFFHYDEKIESADALNWIIDGYTAPTDSVPPIPGYGGWLRAGAKKAFLLVSDDDPTMPAADFVAGLTALAPEHFGADPNNPTFVVHAIGGLAGSSDGTPYGAEVPVEATLCGDVASAGENSQALARMTGGLRSSICSTPFDAIFDGIAESACP